MAKRKFISSKEAVKVEYSPVVCFKLLSGMYPHADKKYLQEYVDFCFNHNQAKGFLVRPRRGYKGLDVRNHHLYPKVLVPTMANSTTNIIQLSKVDHFDAHVLLVLAFSSYYHSKDSKEAFIFASLVRGVGGCLGQIPQKIRSACRDDFSNRFFALTGKVLVLDRQAGYRDYQAVRRSTPLGKAYDNLKGCLRRLELKYNITYENKMSIPDRATSLVSCCLLPFGKAEKDSLAAFLHTYITVKNQVGAQHLVV